MSFQACKIAGRGVAPASYHAPSSFGRGDAQFPMSVSQIKEWQHCPARWRAGYQPPPSSAKDFGSLFDCLLLTPGEFQRRYAMQPSHYETDGMKCPECGSVTDSQKCAKCKRDRVPVKVSKEWSNQSTTCQAWRDARIGEGKTVLDASDLTEAQAAILRFNADETLEAFLDDSDCQVHLTGEWLDEATGLVIPIQCLIDCAPRKRFSSALGDVKTTRSAHPRIWSKYCSQRHYHVQGAFYLDLWNAATGEERTDFCFLLIENYAPWQPGRSLLAQDKQDIGRALYQAWLGRYAQCLKTGVWPDYQGCDEADNVAGGWSLDRATKWDEQEAMLAMAGKAEEPTSPEPVEDNEQDLIP
jgi:hypothetical protein